ncbi:MAG: hypothetical protein IPM84_24780 [Anaerolineae bacterium]|nr:hypothetical protein [Anaerolineae bacterium]
MWRAERGAKKHGEQQAGARWRLPDASQASLAGRLRVGQQHEAIAGALLRGDMHERLGGGHDGQVAQRVAQAACRQGQRSARAQRRGQIIGQRL